MPEEYPDTWVKLYRMFQWQRRENATVGHDHEYLDMIESILWAYASDESNLSKQA